MKQIAVISGKGGTGKTTITAAMAVLSPRKVLVDCDVDAPDLHLLLKPEIQNEEAFAGGREAVIDPMLCTECGQCEEACRFEAINELRVDSIACEGCGLCVEVCPEKCIQLREKQSGKWFISKTDYGPMVHARLGIAQDNSGKLVNIIRKNALDIAKTQGHDYVLIDGPPGIGCPVISSITGVNLVLVVTEPTFSGQHDLERTANLANHFKIPLVVCINKWDLHPENAEYMKIWCEKEGIALAGEIPYDDAVMKALVKTKTVVQYSDCEVSRKIQGVWEMVREFNPSS